MKAHSADMLDDLKYARVVRLRGSRVLALKTPRWPWQWSKAGREMDAIVSGLFKSHHECLLWADDWNDEVRSSLPSLSRELEGGPDSRWRHVSKTAFPELLDELYCGAWGLFFFRKTFAARIEELCELPWESSDIEDAAARLGAGAVVVSWYDDSERRLLLT